MNNATNLNTSETLTNILPALMRARKSFVPIPKTKKNPAFNGSRYAPHDVVNDCIMPSLLENDLMVLQPIESDGKSHFVVTTVYHVSGEFISSKYPLPSNFVLEFKDQRKETIIDDWGKEKTVMVKFTADKQTINGQDDPQRFGAAITYARRYGLLAFFNICADEDDDGNAASNQSSTDRQFTNQSSNGNGKPKTTPQANPVKPTKSTNNVGNGNNGTNGNGSSNNNVGNGKNGTNGTNGTNGNSNGNGKRPMSLSDCYVAIATVCEVTASERDPKAEARIQADPSNNFSVEVQQVAKEWVNKHQTVQDEEAFSNEFWDFIEPQIIQDDSPENFLKVFKDWQTQKMTEIKSNYRDETGALTEYPSF